ncbi:LOG family protein [Candidatus Woesearchaeota archaeon]|nr:LOG family protein [Candidatus Woesearchaeota archaeon]
MQKEVKPIESWKNPEFLASADARLVRIISEYLEPAARFRKYNIANSIVFWGSARILSPKDAKAALVDKKKNGDNAAIRKAEHMVELSRYYADAVKLAELMTVWSKNLNDPHHQFIVATGGAKGIMEAANLGASRAGGKSIGLGISLPFETGLNPYITRELALQFHYFFMRKFWMVYLAKALIAFPGGIGTLDELMEVLTLIQTGKPRKRMPVVLYGSHYWNDIIDFDAMARWGTISEKDLDLFKLCNTPEEAYEYLTERLTALYLKDKSPAPA